MTTRSKPVQVDAASVRGTIDVGIVTIKQEEFTAVLDYFPVDAWIVGQRREYQLCEMNEGPEHEQRVAIVRCAEQGGGAVQLVATDLLDELMPRWLLVVGIAGGRPAAEFGLGDVVVSTRIYDFSVEAVLQDGEREYSLAGGSLHPQAESAAANLPALQERIRDWNSPKSVREKRPPLAVTDDRLEGPDNWQKTVKKSLFEQVRRKRPTVVSGPIASSERLVRNPELLQVWLKMTRHVYAVEMESAGIYRTAHARQVPFLAIRGISDIVGLKRDDNRWTKYACYSAAAFTHAFIPTLPIRHLASEDIGWMIIVEGEYKDFNKSRVEAMATELIKHLSGARLRIERWEEHNSVAIHFKSSRSVLAKIAALFDSGKLDQILDSRVLAVREESNEVKEFRKLGPSQTSVQRNNINVRGEIRTHVAQKQSPRPLRLFLCHSSVDKPVVRDFYRKLRSDGFDPWLDEESLLPGQDWEQEIKDAVRAADIVLACLSRRSITKDGYVHKEIKIALDVADEKAPKTIFLVPVKLEECDLPERLRRLQAVNLFNEGGYEKLMHALETRAGTLGVTVPSTRLRKALHQLQPLLQELEAAGKGVGFGNVSGRLRQALIQFQHLLDELKTAGKVILLEELLFEELDTASLSVEPFVLATAKGISFGDARVFEVHTETGNAKSIVVTSDASSLRADWGSSVIGSGMMPGGARANYYLIFDRDHARRAAKRATTETDWFAPAYPTRTSEGVTTNIELPIGTVTIGELKAQVPSRHQKVPERIVLAAEGDAKPIHAALGAAGSLEPTWTSALRRFADEHRGPSILFTKNIERAREHLNAIEKQDPLRVDEIASMELRLSGEQQANLDNLWFTPSRGGQSRALIIAGENTAKLHEQLRKAADADLLRNKQVALATAFDPKETDALRELVLSSGALMVWTPESRISPAAARKLRNYIEKVDAASTGVPPKGLDDYIDRALERWYREAPDDPDLVPLLEASRFV